MKTYLLTAMALASIIAWSQDERNIIFNHPGNGGTVIIQDIYHDTLPSISRDWRDPLLEGRIGIGVAAINGGQTGGFQPEVELYSQLNDLVGVEVNFSGITDQGDSHYSPEELSQNDAVFKSWSGTASATFTLGDLSKTKLHRVSWRYFTPFNVQYEKHSQAMTRVRYRHQARLGFNIQGGNPLGYTSSISSDATRIVAWNDLSVGNLMLGYAWRLDRWMQVEATNKTSSKNLSRSRTVFADVMMNLHHAIDGDIYEMGNAGGYQYIGDLNPSQLSFSALGVRIGYRGTRMFNIENFGIFHRYELGWRPSYNDSSIGLDQVAPGSKFYFIAAVGIQF
ncbi:MAG: hypothetical protein HWD92_04830 [Flavobacteriia bacterium]|nr:hypothetical protein [Flavobacteriia bacterium]